MSAVRPYSSLSSGLVFAASSACTPTESLAATAINKYDAVSGTGCPMSGKDLGGAGTVAKGVDEPDCASAPPMPALAVAATSAALRSQRDIVCPQTKESVGSAICPLLCDEPSRVEPA